MANPETFADILKVAKKYAPSMVRHLAGDDADNVTEKLLEIAKKTSGAADAGAALTTLDVDAAKLSIFQNEVANLDYELEKERVGSQTAEAANAEIIKLEASSDDPYVRRARPTFLYLIYILIALAIPVGMICAIWPVEGANFTSGVGAWLAALPEQLYWLFGTAYLGYVGARSFDKRRPSSPEQTPGS